MNDLTNGKNNNKLKSKGALHLPVLGAIIMFGIIITAFATIPQILSDRKALTALSNIYEAHKTASGNSRKVAYGCADYSTANMVSRLSSNMLYNTSDELVYIDTDDMTAESGCSTMPTSGSGAGTSSSSKPYIIFDNVNNSVCSDIVSQYVNDSRALNVETDSTLLSIKHSAETTPGNFGEVGGSACNSEDNINTITIWEK